MVVVRGAPGATLVGVVLVGVVLVGVVLAVVLALVDEVGV